MVHTGPMVESIQKHEGFARIHSHGRLKAVLPLIAKMNPAASANVIDFYQSGGVPAVMAELLPLLHV